MHQDKNPDEKPKKFKDHAMDALRYAIADLPDDPMRILLQSFAAHESGNKIYTVTKDGQVIATDRDDDDDDDWNTGRKEEDWLNYW